MDDQRKQTPNSNYCVRDPKRLGQLLRDRRKKQGLTLTEFYEASNLTTRFVSELERGKLAFVDRLLKALHMLGLELMIVPRGEAERLQHFLADHNE